MSVRKRTWTTPKGEPREAWIADYVDQHGARHMRTFATKKDAKDWHAGTAIEVKRGVHTASSRSVTVVEAGRLRLETAEKNKLERAPPGAEAHRCPGQAHSTRAARPERYGDCPACRH
jgi:integrase